MGTRFQGDPSVLSPLTRPTRRAVSFFQRLKESSPKDWMDVETVIMKNAKGLKKNYIFKQLKPLCELKEAPEIVNKLDNILKNVSDM